MLRTSNEQLCSLTEGRRNKDLSGQKTSARINHISQFLSERRFTAPSTKRVQFKPIPSSVMGRKPCRSIRAVEPHAAMKS